MFGKVSPAARVSLCRLVTRRYATGKKSYPHSPTEPEALEKLQQQMKEHCIALISLPIVKRAAFEQLPWLKALQVAIAAATPPPMTPAAASPTATATAGTGSLDNLLEAIDAFFNGSRTPVAAALTEAFLKTQDLLLELLEGCVVVHSASTPSRHKVDLESGIAETLQQGVSAPSARRFVDNFHRTLTGRDLKVSRHEAPHEVPIELFLAAGRLAGRGGQGLDADWAEIRWMWEEVSGERDFSADALAVAQLRLVLRNRTSHTG
ncbi:hypothetical protein C8R46DRAFT_1351330 [Mycena filopes]|nr:hypothetical protein C8R46DRAFT_1351330 [Mycena filopes]